ncbi:MAG: Phenylalanyl-tRNA synthetase alpha chain [Candidatus Magnetoglobus multicellularis str. Araruama]|uniref:Phenylalanine--tRNA ligase alpha subunit n=1 Tax=Candidatus Magnetoglobus multicellularis str. Araruama TaxID=890399 RepID=A0A1V1PHE7_9BACT|nr:MAG: Phenylalanyl-tRNA synthetase alpha chain [Candidatus Magnetoglobus multicellularis str. Araruama]
MNSPGNKLEQIKTEAMTALASASDISTIQDIQTRFLGRKGILTRFLRNISEIPKDLRPEAGKSANILKKQLEKAFQFAIKDIQRSEESKKSGIDITLPGRPVDFGSSHPLTAMNQEICHVFTQLGFDIVEGPEVELDFYNFEALNIPKNHPARDMHDTFYISDKVVLRTHTSPIQIRTMERRKPPIQIIAPGKVYRCDSDITHTPMFQQIEGLMVDEGIHFGHLKGILTTLVHQIFDEHTDLRFRPSFFPFTEPSAEIDMLCVICRGKGCRVCSKTGWLEILGAGMVHPAVFENVHYDTEKYTGFAFGMGVERIAMLKYGIDDIRKFYDNDIRFLDQF